jgi:hypothetical protein
MNEKYTKNERTFYNRVFGFEFWDVPEELIEAASADAKIQLPLGVRRLDILVRSQVRFIHEFLFFSAEKEEVKHEGISKIMRCLLIRVLKFLVFIFEKDNNQPISQSYYQDFRENFVISIYLSYNKAEYEKYISQSILSYGYTCECSAHVMNEYIDNIKNRHIRNFTGLKDSLENLSQSKQEIEIFFSRMKKNYQTNTLAQKKQFGIIGFIGFSLFVILTILLFSNNLISPSLTNLSSMFAGLAGILFFANTVNDRFANREINSRLKKEYLENFPKYYHAYKTLSLSEEQREVLKLSLKDDMKQLDRINSNEKNRVNLFHKWSKENPQKAIKYSIVLQNCVIPQLTWEKTGVTDEINAILERKNTTSQLPLCRLSSGNSSGHEFCFPGEAVKKARKVYQYLKTEKKSIDNEILVENSKNTYTKIAKNYLLTLEQKKQGILVLEYPGSPSKAFIKYGEHKAIITERVGPKLNNGVLERGFGRGEGDFDVFKYLKNLKRYEYKPFDNLRIEYAKTEDKEEIVDNEKNTYQVPVWEEVKNYKKSS